MKNLNLSINETITLTIDDYYEGIQAEPTNRLLPDSQRELTEWYGYGEIAGLNARAVYMTGPEDETAVELAGGDYGVIDWYDRLMHIDIMTNDGVPVVILHNPDYIEPIT